MAICVTLYGTVTKLDFHAHKIPALDGIRAIAVLLVFAQHVTPMLLVSGRIGVDVFFVLSGFLITSILLQEHQRTGSVDIKRFYIRRALRLLPAVVSLLVFVIAYTAIIHPYWLAMTLRDALCALFYVFNWELVVLYPQWLDHQLMFTHLWSLSIEEQFYIVWPLALLLLARGSLRMRIAVLLAAIAAISLARALLWIGAPGANWYFNTFVRFDGLLWGALVALLVHAGIVPAGTLKRLMAWLAPLALVGLFAMTTKEGWVNGWLYLYGYALIGLFSALLIYCSVVCPLSWFTPILELKPLRWIGMVSYGLYLWHAPILRIAQDAGLGLPGQIAGAAIAFAITALSFYYYERPFLLLKDRLAAPRK